MKKWIGDYLRFTKKEKTGILALLVIIALVASFPYITGNLDSRKSMAIDTTWISEIKKLEEKTPSAPARRDKYRPPPGEPNDHHPDYGHSPEKKELFYFDPNTLPQQGWKQLGLPDKTIRTIQNYISKGGQFRQAGDLKKVFGLRLDDYERLLPYIKISDNRQAVEKEKTFAVESNSKNAFHHPVRAIVDINTADTSAFIALPGIGSKLASRIIRFRERLGGFYLVEQIREVYGLADSVYQQISKHLEIGNTTIKKIDLNTTTADELQKHPYIKNGIAGILIAYRDEHGRFLQLEDIKKAVPVTDEEYQKIVPYFTVQ